MRFPIAFPRKSKYRNIKTTIDGITFDSRKESRYYQELLLLKKCGQVKDIELQPKFVLVPSYKIGNKVIRGISYIADFLVKYPNGNEEIIDVKGRKTEVYKIKKKLFEFLYKGRIIKEV